MSPPHFRCESKQLWLLKESIVIYFKLGQCPKLMEIRPLFVRKKLEYFLFCFLHIIVTVSFWFPMKFGTTLDLFFFCQVVQPWREQQTHLEEKAEANEKSMKSERYSAYYCHTCRCRGCLLVSSVVPNLLHLYLLLICGRQKECLRMVMTCVGHVKTITVKFQ